MIEQDEQQTAILVSYLEVARRLYSVEHGSVRAYSYQPIIDHFADEHGEVLVQIEEDDYQGDTWVVYHHPGAGPRFLTFGWGSCSGCDRLQAAGDGWSAYDENDIFGLGPGETARTRGAHKEIGELIWDLERGIRKFDSFEELLAWVEAEDIVRYWSSVDGKIADRIREALTEQGMLTPLLKPHADAEIVSADIIMPDGEHHTVTWAQEGEQSAIQVNELQ